MVEALRKAIETFSAAPHPPRESGTASPSAPREQIVRNVKRFESEVSQWRSEMLVVQSSMTEMYKGLSILNMHTLEQVSLSGLDEFIDFVDKEIESERLDLERSRLSIKQTVATIRKTSSGNAHFANGILKRIYDAGVVRHNARVDFYRFLLQLRAEHNPDYRGGPTFENAEDLIADLHKNAR